MIKTYDFQKMPIVDILNDILVDSAKRGASDIHFDPYVDHLLIRVRIDGILHDYVDVPKEFKDYLITRIKTVARLNITESRLPQDGAIKTSLQGVDLDLRVSSLPVTNGEKIVIRILDYSMSMAGLNELSFSEKNYKKLLEMISVPNGIILVTGATGSGKSTTVYSILQHLNTSETNIITVEDPVEMDISGINQVQTNSKIGLTFATALRSILRQDPNIIMIGEIRDTETARIAVRASITGHLVLSTLHTNTSLNTIERLIDMDVQKYLLASALEGVISQKLARRLCNHCKKKRPTSNYEKSVFKSVLGIDVSEIYDTEGCEYCDGGFHGRIPIHEVLKINQKIRDALSNDEPKDVIRNLVYGEADVTTMLQDGLEKVLQGFTSFGEIIKLIELDDDDQVSGDTSFKQSIAETKTALAAQIQKERANKTNYVIDSSSSNQPTANIVQPVNSLVNNIPVSNSVSIYSTSNSSANLNQTSDIVNPYINGSNLNQPINISNVNSNTTGAETISQSTSPSNDLSNIINS
ncbi:MAG: type II/IV secretion system protein [Bacilli bacterium]|nr:type II/IV secretion system protein [Bacilli bacterium]